jgi:hypothetical protein
LREIKSVSAVLAGIFKGVRRALQTFNAICAGRIAVCISASGITGDQRRAASSAVSFENKSKSPMGASY